jgi:hypothetical protein
MSLTPLQAISCLCSAVMYEQRGVAVIFDDAWRSLYNRQSLSSSHWRDILS